MVGYTNSSVYVCTYGSNRDVWGRWNITYSTSAATTSSTYPTTWPFTCSNTTTISTADYYIWPTWVANATRASPAPQVRARPTEAEVKAALEREQQYRREAEERARKVAEAKERADQLLRACLSPKQLEDLERRHCFYVEVDGRDGKKERYRIDRGQHGNVKQLDEKGSIIRSFCIQPAGVPDGDAMLAQKMFLESSEETRERFWSTANITELMAEKRVPGHIPRNQRRKYAIEHGLLH